MLSMDLSPKLLDVGFVEDLDKEPPFQGVDELLRVFRLRLCPKIV